MSRARPYRLTSASFSYVVWRFLERTPSRYRSLVYGAMELFAVIEDLSVSALLFQRAFWALDVIGSWGIWHM